MDKYCLKCIGCGSITNDFQAWFEQGQACLKCGSRHSEILYNSFSKAEFETMLSSNKESFWSYFDLLPLKDPKHIITRNEGAVPIERWHFLEDYAKQNYGISIQVQVCRNDLNGGTGTFKDVAAALAAAILSEVGITQYCVASTGNTATAYGFYLSLAGINASIFIPNNAIKASEAMISAFGQQVYRTNGDYAYAKKVANDYAEKYQVPISIGNIDPIRVEAKKTMVFEWLRQLGTLPDVYIQALSGGTGVLAIDKGIREIGAIYEQAKNPRFIMVQPDGCNPMVQAWEKAVATNFPEGYEEDYPIIDSLKTTVPTLSTGNPTSYPLLAKLVREANGTFITVKESQLSHYGKLIAFEKKILLGPASAVCIAGFFESLAKGLIHNDEIVLLNVGEGVRRAPEFIEMLKLHDSKQIEFSEQCEPHQMASLRQQLWDAISH